MWPSDWVFMSYSCSDLIALSQVRVSKVSNVLIFSLSKKLFFIIEVFLLHFQYIVVEQRVKLNQINVSVNSNWVHAPEQPPGISSKTLPGGSGFDF